MARVIKRAKEQRTDAHCDIGIKGFQQFGGRHCETGALRNTLAYLGLAAPHTGRPFSEEMLLGIGGGIAVSYWVFEFGGQPSFFVGARYSEKSPGPEFSRGVCERLGVDSRLYRTVSPARGLADLRGVLQRGTPAIVWGDMALLPYFALPENAHFGGHTFVVYGLRDSDDTVLIADRSQRGFQIRQEELAAARASRHKPFPPQHKLLEILQPLEMCTSERLERAIIRGISDCCRRMLVPPIANFGVPGLHKWAAMVANTSSRKGWPQVFKPGLDLFGALLSTFIFIEIGGTGGSAFRSMYADFLQEAGEALGTEKLRTAAQLYTEAARCWSALAAAALPDAVPPLGRMRRLLTKKNSAFEARGSAAHSAMVGINVEMDNIVQEIRSGGVDWESVTAPLLQEMRDRLIALAAIEKEAVNELKAAIQ
jgi:hypothetical protein